MATTTAPFPSTIGLLRSTTLRSSIGTVSGYTHFLLLLISFVLTLAAVMCAARIIFVYCTYKRRREETEAHTRHRRVTTATETDQVFQHPSDGSGIENYGFSNPPPRYDQVCKEDEPPPLYESLRSHGRTTNLTVENREGTQSCIPASAVQSQGGGTLIRVPEHAPPYRATDSNPPRRRSAGYAAEQVDAPAASAVNECNLEGVVVVSTASQRIQNHMEAVRRRFSGNVEQLIASLSVTSPPLMEPSHG